jgi:trehalose 6-phosphate phosphatase
MKNILSQSNRELLKRFATSKVLLAFDYDGTLAPIVADPELARMRERTRDLLCLLTRRYPVAVISGRAQPDALKRLRGTGLYEVVGNHGMEPWHASQRNIAEVHRWLPLLGSAVAQLQGVAIEDKSYSVAVHYRRSREKTKARAAILKAAAKLGEVRIIAGKQVVNILPLGAPHKGAALERAKARLSCETAIYVGDDETDEDVFALDHAGRLLTVRVGQKRDSAAAYYLVRQAAIDTFMAALIEHRSNSSLCVGVAQ